MEILKAGYCEVKRNMSTVVQVRNNEGLTRVGNPTMKAQKGMMLKW